MDNQAIKIELDEIALGIKVLNLTDSLTSIRDKIKDKINTPYAFLNKRGLRLTIDEKSMKLKDIVVGKTMKLKSLKICYKEVEIYLNDQIIFSRSFTAKETLEEIRKVLLNQIKEDFIFFDSFGSLIEKSNESIYHFEDIIIDNKLIRLKSKKIIIQSIIALLSQKK